MEKEMTTKNDNKKINIEKEEENKFILYTNMYV